MSDSSITPELPRSPEAPAEGFANVGAGDIDVDHSEVLLGESNRSEMEVMAIYEVANYFDDLK